MNKLNGKITTSATLRGAMTRGAGGGTYVEANPEGEAIDTLEKLMVEDEIFEIRNVPDASSAHNGDVLTKTANGFAWIPLPETGVIYSTNEQVIGKWINGKILYQKTVTYNGSSGLRISIPLGVSNVEYIFLCSDGSFINTGSEIMPVPYVTGTDNSNNVGGYFDLQNGTFELRAGSGSSGSTSNVTLTIRYTKVGE